MSFQSIVQLLAQMFCGSPRRRPRTPPGVRRGQRAVHDWPAFMPEQNPLEDDAAGEGRRDAALRMMDDDVYGFLLVTVHKTEGACGEVRIAGELHPSFAPAVARTLEMVLEVERSS